MEEKRLLNHIIKDSKELIYADDISLRDDLNYREKIKVPKI